MKNATFKFYAGHMSLNSVSIAVYEDNKTGEYILQAETNGAKIRDSVSCRMTKEQYENLPWDANSSVRFLAAASKCGIEFEI